MKPKPYSTTALPDAPRGNEYKNSAKLISANAVRDLCGGISDMTLWRWLADPELAFPRPTRIGKRRYFREAEIFDWIEVQAEASRGAA